MLQRPEVSGSSTSVVGTSTVKCLCMKETADSVLNNIHRTINSNHKMQPRMYNVMVREIVTNGAIIRSGRKQVRWREVR